MRKARPSVTVLALALVAAWLVAPPARGDEEIPPPPLSTVAWVDAPIATVWETFTTAEGWKKFGIAQVEVDFRVGGTIRSHYDPNGTLGDEKTIENTILAFSPQRMLTIRASKAPVGSPIPPEVLASTWSVFTFTDLGDGRTRIVIRGHGYGTDEASKRVRAFFQQGNAWTMQQLASRIGRKRSAAERVVRPIELGVVVPATLEAVHAAWRGEDPAMEIEGATLQASIPHRLLAFALEDDTQVTVELEREDAHHTRLWFTHAGFEDGVVRERYAASWPRALKAFAKRFSHAGAKWD